MYWAPHNDFYLSRIIFSSFEGGFDRRFLFNLKRIEIVMIS